jgi:hypothetical protein
MFEEDRKYRIFLSNSHQDLAIAQSVDAILRRNKLRPMWDEHFAYGHGFHDQIKKFIGHAHAFLPILPHSANQRNWVHQEIGYAMALNAPVLPLAIGEVPGEMIRDLHAIRIAQTEAEQASCVLPDLALENLAKALTPGEIERLMRERSDAKRVPFACANFPDARAEMLAEYCEDVRTLGGFGLVRQKGALSSFHIPTETIRHQIWRDRYEEDQRSDEHCELQRQERFALTRHAEVAGCKLIVDPFLKYDRYGENARRVRLKCLYDFLNQMPNAKCQVAICRNMGHGLSNTYVGDWFAAESVLAILGKGYYQTIFTRHAALVRKRTAEFDSEFDELLALEGGNQPKRIAPEDSRTFAMEIIAREIDQLPVQQDSRETRMH